MKNTMDKILLAFIYWSHYRDSLSIWQYGQVVDGNDGNGTVPVLVRYRTVNKLWWKNKTTVLVLVPYCYSIVPVTVFKHDFLFFLFLKKKIPYIEI